MKRRFVVEIEVDEKNISDKYPNFKLNYGTNFKEFIKSLMKDFEYEGNTNMAKDGLKEWGYSKKVLKEITKSDRRYKNDKEII